MDCLITKGKKKIIKTKDSKNKKYWNKEKIDGRMKYLL